MRATAIAALFGALPCLPVAALKAQDFTHFEVATIRDSPAPSSDLPLGAVPAPTLQGGPGTPDPGQISYQGIGLFALIIRAFDVKNFQVASPPGGIGSGRYDIVAKIPAGTTQDQFRVMLQNLLKERFHLTLHHETRTLPVYALVVGPNGPKLKKSPPKTEDVAPDGAIGRPDAEGFPVLPPGFSGVVGRPSSGHMLLAGQRAALSKLTPWLQNSLDHPVIDETGLTGEYDFKLDFEWVTPNAPPTPNGQPPDPAPSVFAVVEHDLGLKLESQKLPFDIMVIDRIDKEATAN